MRARLSLIVRTAMMSGGVALLHTTMLSGQARPGAPQRDHRAGTATAEDFLDMWRRVLQFCDVKLKGEKPKVATN